MFAMDDNWDLQAVVRSCTQPDANGTTASWFDIDPFTFPSSPLPLLQEDDFADLCCTYFPDLLATPTVELEELFKPFYSDKTTTTTNHADHPSPPLLSPQQDQQKQKPQQQEQKQRPVSRSKRRKNQQKRVVCQVPTEELSSDMWAWRKYGQKPIKGSPYPRSYYRCSSSKGCPARKQVERSQADPAMFIITYSSEHNHPLPTHRNSLAGSTRQKYPESAAAPTRVAAASEPPKVCSPLSLSPRTPLIPPLGEHGHDHELHIQPHKEELLEDFDLEGEDGEMFMDLEELSEGGAALSSPSSSAFEDCFVTAAAAATATEVNGQHHFPPFSCSPWLVNNTATAARGR